MEPHGLALRLYRGSDIHQQPLDSPDIPHARNALQNDRLFGEQRRRQRGQSRILRTAGGDLALENGATGNRELIH